MRAVTGAGGVLESTSDGFVVDATSPVVVVTAVGATAVNTTDSAVLYQKETDSYTATWRVDDGESGVADVAFRLGSFPGRKHGFVGMAESRWLICSLAFWNQLRFIIKSSEIVVTFGKIYSTSICSKLLFHYALTTVPCSRDDFCLSPFMITPKEFV